jgi:hypothetical protein
MAERFSCVRAPGGVIWSTKAVLEQRRLWLVPALAALAVTALYVRTASPSVGGGNSGEFQVMAHLLGIAHPPSYPLYLLLAKAISLVPLPGDVAWRINVLTALLAGASIFLAGVLPLVLRLPRERSARLFASALAVVVTGTMPRLWTLAVEAEVFSLHLALVLAFWLCLLCWQERRTDVPRLARLAEPSAKPSGHQTRDLDPDSLLHHDRKQVGFTRDDRWLLGASILAGLALANHRTSLFAAAGGVLFVLFSDPRILRRIRLLAACAVLFVAGLAPYLYVLRGWLVPIAYFSPGDVRRLSRGEIWYVLQGNAAGETAGGEIIRQLFADGQLLNQRLHWLWGHVAGQFGLAGGLLAICGIAGLVFLWRYYPLWTSTSIAGAAGAAIFAMSYAKYPDADRYLLPLHALIALGLAVFLASIAAQIARALGRANIAGRGMSRAAGSLLGLACGVYWSFSLGILAGTTSFTRGGYVHHTLHNLQGVEQRAVVCSWWASAWGWWYAQYVDGHRLDVTLVPKGPDDCVRDVVPEMLGQRPVYVPAMTEFTRKSDIVFFPSRDLWIAVGRRTPMAAGTLLKGPDDRIFYYDGTHRRWIPSLEVFAAHGFSWDAVHLTPDYVLRDIPEGPLLSD